MLSVRPALATMILVSLMLTGAIFGFFYAWICSTMWGLDAADPRVAIAAMQSMNGSVRNAVFFPAFFLTPAFLTLTAMLLVFDGYRLSGLLTALAAATYLLFGLFLTMGVNVPMNEALAVTPIPVEPTEAARIWQDYSKPWQFWNTMRTIASGAALLLVGLAMLALPRRLTSAQH